MPQLSNSVVVAAIQSAPVSFDLPKSLRKVAQFTSQAAAAGADLVVFPEGFLSAYPWRYAFDATIGTREPREAGRKWYSRYYNSAVAIPSPELDQLCEIASNNNVHLQVGIIEKDGGTLYCTALLLSRDGAVLSRHRKLIPTAAERLVWGRGAGDGLDVVDLDIGKVGGLIWIYIAPNADDLPSWIATMQHIAKEGRCFVISVNQFCKVSDFPSDYPPFTPEHYDRKPDGSRWEAEDVLSHGGSCVVGPLGTFVSQPVWDKEEIILATLEMSDIVEARLDFDPVGSYSRPDIFSLTVSKKPGVNVAFEEAV
ncbi:nitrilase [Penicillium canariense]|uniref:Nitrilase n=1 Tax=Penicillium canariense TaxID=189055 RepID=A0A9W9LFU3_9EURO|nr:nitrilase [Penicillium canariense]KAJ5152722.1 nitrilase [Penicillium canariense]